MECEAREQLLSSGSSRDAAQRWEKRALELRRHCGPVRTAPSSRCRRRLLAVRRRTLPLAVQRADAVDAQVVHSVFREEFARQLAAGALQMRTSYSQQEWEQTKQVMPSHLLELLEVSNSHCVQWLAVGAEAHKSRESQSGAQREIVSFLKFCCMFLRRQYANMGLEYSLNVII